MYMYIHELISEVAFPYLPKYMTWINGVKLFLLVQIYCINIYKMFLF